MENVNSEDYVGVSPRRACVGKIPWGSLIPTYESGFSDLFIGWNAPLLRVDLNWVCHRELLLRGDLPFNTSTGDLRSVHVRGLETGTIK